MIKEWWNDLQHKWLQIILIFLGALNLSLPITAEIWGKGINIIHMFNIMVGTWVYTTLIYDIWGTGHWYRQIRKLVQKSQNNTSELLEITHKLQKENTRLREGINNN